MGEECVFDTEKCVFDTHRHPGLRLGDPFCDLGCSNDAALGGPSPGGDGGQGAMVVETVEGRRSGDGWWEGGVKGSPGSRVHHGITGSRVHHMH